MNKNKSSFFYKSSKILLLVLKTVEFFTFISLLAIFILLWQKPNLITKFVTIPVQSTENLDNIKTQITNINKDMDILSNAVLNDKENFDLLKNNIAFFDKSKADLSEITNINNRMYDMEKQMFLLSKRPSNGALLLTIALLIRDNISRGLTCQNEAEGLKILAENFNSINEDVDFITSHCSMNFISNNSLANNFDTIYKEITKPAIEKDWKKRIISKISEYIKISTPKNKNDVQAFDLNTVLAKIKQLVDNDDFAAASVLLSKPENSALLKDKRIFKWYQQTEKQLKFYESLSNIINNSLLIMKVENARSNQE